MAQLRLPKLKTRSKLDALLSKLAETGHPAVFMGAAHNKEILYFNQAGDRVYGDKDLGEVGPDTPVELYSQTKLVTAVATHKLVDRGLLELDDPEVVKKHIPELAAQKVLIGYDGDEPILEEVEHGITVRMLLNHTSGLIYPFVPSILSKWCAQHGVANQFTQGLEGLTTPLAFQPGTNWAYSQSYDWLGVLIERLTRQKLERHFNEHIFHPLGLRSFTFFPDARIASTKMHPVMLSPDGTMRAVHYGLGRPSNPVDVKLRLGGAGLYGSQREYLHFLRQVLAYDPANPTYQSNQLLSPAGFAALFTPCLPTDPAVHARCEAALAGFMNLAFKASPPVAPGDVSYSAGLGINVKAGLHGRRHESAFWAGAARTHFWIDPVANLVAVVGTNVLSDGEVLSVKRGVWEEFVDEFEEVLYDSIEYD